MSFGLNKLQNLIKFEDEVLIPDVITNFIAQPSRFSFHFPVPTAHLEFFCGRINYDLIIPLSDFDLRHHRLNFLNQNGISLIITLPYHDIIYYSNVFNINYPPTKIGGFVIKQGVSPLCSPRLAG